MRPFPELGLLASLLPKLELFLNIILYCVICSSSYFLWPLQFVSLFVVGLLVVVRLFRRSAVAICETEVKSSGLYSPHISARAKIGFLHTNYRF